jgi:hypothetical protein
MAAVLHHQPTPLAQVRAASRPRSTPSSRAASRRIRQSATRPRRNCTPRSKSAALPRAAQPRAGRVTRPVLSAIIVVALLAAGTATWVSVRSSRVRWARQVGLPEIESLVARDQPDAAARLLAQVQTIIPDDPQLARLTNDGMDPIMLETTPAGVDVATKSYRDPTGEWLPLGRPR